MTRCSCATACCKPCGRMCPRPLGADTVAADLQRSQCNAYRVRILLNAVDDLPHCSFIAPAVHRAGDIAVAVSTGGKRPALAVRLREQIGTLIGQEHAEFLDLLGELRPTVAARVPDPKVRTRLWY